MAGLFGLALVKKEEKKDFLDARLTDANRHRCLPSSPPSSIETGRKTKPSNIRKTFQKEPNNIN